MHKREKKAMPPEVDSVGEEIDRGDESEDAAGASLEKKYASQMRQIFPTKIDLPLLTLKTQIEQQIDLAPDFQRRKRWSNERRSRFIESFIMNVPIPPVFLGEEEYGKYVVLDGRQRLTAAYDFLSDRLRLEKLEIWEELNGCTYSDLRKSGLAVTIERRFMPAVLLTKESSPEVKYEVFDRLNTGGVEANPMEVRNAIYHGAFNKLLHTLSTGSDFRKLWGIPGTSTQIVLEKNATYREMGDLELVLRFFALRGATLGGMRFKDRLSVYMHERNEAYSKAKRLKEIDTALFQRATRNAMLVFGEDAFRRPVRTGDGDTKKQQRSAPYADAVLQSLADIDLTAANRSLLEAIATALIELARDDADFIASVSTGTNGESAIQNRITKARNAVARIPGVARIKEGHEQLDNPSSVPKRKQRETKKRARSRKL